MQNFITSSGRVFCFEDNVTVTIDGNGNSTATYDNPATKSKETLDVPKDLKPYTPVPDTPDVILAKAINAKKVSLRAFCALAITSGFLCGTTRYPSDDRSQGNIRDVCASPTGGLIWCRPVGSDWQFLNHTVTDAENVRSAMFVMIQACQKQYSDLVSSLSKAETLEQVEAISWPSTEVT